MRPSAILLLITAVLVSSCANTSKLEPNSPVAIGENETIVVLGVVPSYEVSFVAGGADEKGWSDDMWAFPISNFPENGYVAAKISSFSGAESYGIALIRPRGIAGQRFMACQGDKVLVFPAPAGKVIYLGDINYDLDLQTGKTLGYKRSLNPDKAKLFLATYYPDLASRMETQETNELAVTTYSLCDLPHLIPVAPGVMLPVSRTKRAHPPGTYGIQD